MNPDWKELAIGEKKTLVRGMVVDGLSNAQIAGRFTNATRNSVIGFVHRYFPELVNRAKPKAARRMPPRPYQPRPVKTVKQPDLPVEPLPRAPKIAANSKPIPFLDALGMNACKWPLWGDEPLPLSEKLCCGAPAAVGLSYCEEHQRASTGPGTYSERDAVRQAERQAAE